MTITLSQVEPSTRTELLSELTLVRQQAGEFWDSIADHAFFAQSLPQWSPAENVRHLTKTTLPVIWSLRTPRAVLRGLFGRATRPSRSYRQIVDRYREVLNSGGQAGWFTPRRQAVAGDLSGRRKTTMKSWNGACEKLVAAATAWDDAALDRYRIPHPLLGKLTVHEMLLFTLYHQRHHTQIVMRRLAE